MSSVTSVAHLPAADHMPTQMSTLGPLVPHSIPIGSMAAGPPPLPQMFHSHSHHPHPHHPHPHHHHHHPHHHLVSSNGGPSAMPHTPLSTTLPINSPFLISSDYFNYGPLPWHPSASTQELWPWHKSDLKLFPPIWCSFRFKRFLSRLNAILYWKFIILLD